MQIQVWHNGKWEINAEKLKIEDANIRWENLLLLEKFGFISPLRLVSNGVVLKTFDPMKKLDKEFILKV